MSIWHYLPNIEEAGAANLDAQKFLSQRQFFVYFIFESLSSLQKSSKCLSHPTAGRKFATITTVSFLYIKFPLCKAKFHQGEGEQTP
jgi:hypothetical protein